MKWNLQENILNDQDIHQLVEFISTTERFTQFEKVKQFEGNFSKWQGCKYSVYVNSGSSANFLLINALKEINNWDIGDEIIVPAVTWPTTFTPIIQMGLKPVFVDINLNDLSFDYEKLAQNITNKTRGVFIVHLLGFPSNIEKIKDITKDNNITLIEDCCESQGAEIKGNKVGNLTTAGTFSFYWGHHMTTVEGGMISTNNFELYKLLLLKRSHGLARELPVDLHDIYKEKYKDIDFNFLFLTDGFNYRNTELHAAIGISQLKKIDKYIEIRNKNYKRFIAMCEQFPDDLLCVNGANYSSFTLPFFFKNTIKKEQFQIVLKNKGIEFRPLISGNLLRQPFLKKYYKADTFNNSDYIHNNAFYIGNNQFVDKYRLDYLEEILIEFLSQ